MFSRPGRSTESVQKAHLSPAKLASTQRTTHPPIYLKYGYSMTQQSIRNWIFWFVGTCFFLWVLSFGWNSLFLLGPAPVNADFVTYWLAGHTWLLGGDPYESSFTLALLEADPALSYLAAEDRGMFVYPPHIVLWCAGLAQLPLEEARMVYYAIGIGGLTTSCLLWLQLLGRRVELEDLVLVLCTVGLAMGNAVHQDLAVGNVTMWELTFLWIGISYWVLRDKVGLFGVFVGLASSFKGSLAMLLFLPLCRRLDRGTLRALAPGLLLAVGPHLAGWLLAPQAYGKFVNTVRSLDEMTTSGNFSLFGMLREHWGHSSTATGTYFVVATAVIGLTGWALRRQWRLDGDTARLRFWTMVCGCLAYGVVVPRLKDYSLLLMMLPILAVVQSRLNPLFAALLAFAMWTVPVEFADGPSAVIAAAWALSLFQLYRGRYDLPARNPWPGIGGEGTHALEVVAENP